MVTNQAKRLDKIENKLRHQLHDMEKRAIEDALATLPPAEKAALFRSMGKLATIPAEHKADPVQLSAHFAQAEINLLYKVDALLQQPPFTLAQEAVLTLRTALRACERIRGG
jgi:hypothetical protein